jgi:hypothetical protein
VREKEGRRTGGWLGIRGVRIGPNEVHVGELQGHLEGVLHLYLHSNVLYYLWTSKKEGE